jgi:hypothetical protein
MSMENYRLSRLVFVVITDGQENTSREVRRDQIFKMIRDKEARCDWQFVFLNEEEDHRAVQPLGAVDGRDGHAVGGKATLCSNIMAQSS